MKRLAVIAHEKNDVIASEIDDENDTYSMLKLKILSTIKFIRSRKKRADIESMYDQVMKTNSPKLQISSIDEVLSKLIDHNLVSNKKTSTGLDSFRMLTEEPVDDQIYFSILDRDKKSSEQLSDDSQGIPDSCQINVVPPINTSILDISTEFVTENLCGGKTKENNLISSFKTETPRFSKNSTIASIPTDCDTPQLANIVVKLSTNQDMEKIDA